MHRSTSPIVPARQTEVAHSIKCQDRWIPIGGTSRQTHHFSPVEGHIHIFLQWLLLFLHFDARGRSSLLNGGQGSVICRELAVLLRSRLSPDRLFYVVFHGSWKLSEDPDPIHSAGADSRNALGRPRSTSLRNASPLPWFPCSLASQGIISLIIQA